MLLEERLRSERAAGKENEELQSLREEIKEFYCRAYNSDPSDVTSIADYARYMLSEYRDVGTAGQLLNRALQLDPRSEVDTLPFLSFPFL